MFSMSRSGRRRSINIWPGFVDALATLLMVIIFVLMVFMVAQFTLSSALSGRDRALEQLNREIAELADLLSLQKSENTRLRASITQLTTELQSSISSRDSLASQLALLAEEKEDLEGQVQAVTRERDELGDQRQLLAEQLSALEAEAARISAESAKVNAELEDAYKVIEADREKIETQLAEIALLKQLRDDLANKLSTQEESTRKQEKLTAEAEAAVVLLNQQIAALRQQLANVSEALEISEAKNEEQKAQIVDLGRRLNVALATKVQQLARYRSEFFGRLRELLGDRQDIRIVGDRFVFQSEVLFASGSAELGEDGKEQMAQLAKTLREISAEIPDDIEWILRVDGHTDENPIATAEFPSNWELSTARATSVVKFLISQGIPANRLAATGFGEFQPLDPGQDEIAYRRNRRIELKLTQR